MQGGGERAPGSGEHVGVEGTGPGDENRVNAE